MSWFPSSNIASLAKNALKEAQKTIDKALDINDDAAGRGGINTTVSSVTDAATDFFSSWGVGVGIPSPSKNEPKQHLTDVHQPVVTAAPTLKSNKSTASLPNGDTYSDTDPTVIMQRSFTATDISCELVAPDQEYSETLIEALEGDPWSHNSEKLPESDPKNQNLKEVELLDPNHDGLHQNSVEGSTDAEAEKIIVLEQESAVEATQYQGAKNELDHDHRPSDLEHQSILDHEGELDSSSATVIADQDDADVNSILNSAENPMGSLECEIDLTSSKISVSSRATSSISVISEEKDSSSPQISPSSAHNALDSGDSPSFEIIPINSHHHQSNQRKSDSNSNFDFLGSQPTCPSGTSSVSIIPSLQSTPDRGTPLTHSRSNSNTSSSFDRIEEYNNRSKCPSHHFISSTSSSDIEVIPLPLDSVSLENLHLIHRKRKSVAEAEIQTVEPWPEKPDTVEVTPAKISSIIAEKDCEILQLREEGEKLSKKQFELSTAIKKLRQKEKDTDVTVKSLKNDLVAKNTEIEKLQKLLITKESQDQIQNETISKLNAENRKLLGTISQLRSELEDAQENTASMKASVEDASVEILELQNVIESVQRDTLQLDSLTKQNGELTNRNDSLQKEVEQLRHSLNSVQLKSTTRESELQTLVHNLTSKVHSFENQLADQSSEIADATMPLSLEIEKLQQELISKAAAAERREVGYQNKISELESRVKAQIEAGRGFKSSQSSLQNSCSELEAANERLKAEKLALSNQLQAELTLKGDHLRKISEFSSLEARVQVLSTEVGSLRRENESLKIELKAERNSLQTEAKRSQMLAEQIKLMSSSNQAVGIERVSFSSASMKHEEGSRNTSPRSIMSEASYLDDVLDPNGQNPCLTPRSFFDSFSSVNYIEGLQGHLRQKELELVQLHEEVSKNEKIRKSLNDEIAHLTVNNEELLQRVEKFANLEQRVIEVEKNYNAVLQMYGEKVEEADELRLDLQDVKEMYKAQIEQLLRKS